MNDAEWSVDETAELARNRREGFVLSKEFFRRAKVQTALVVAAAGIMGSAIYHVSTAYRFGDEGFVLLAVAALSLGAIPLARHWEKRQEARHEVEPEMREALGHDGRLVALIVRQGDAPTGEDHGMLWFENGRLYFAGRRTSFGLVPGQTRGFATIDDTAPGVRHRLNLGLKRESSAGPMSISLAPYVSSLANPDAALGALKADLDRWKHGPSAGVGQWPPVELGPCVVSERRLLARAVGTALMGGTLPAAFMLLVSARTVAVFAFVLGMLVFTFAPRQALVWRAWWARRRLRRQR